MEESTLKETAASEPIVRKTHSPCPDCAKILETDIVQRGNELYMIKECPEHGNFDILFKKDLEFYEKVSSIANQAEPYQPEDSPDCQVALEHARIISIDLTERCNMECPVCFTDANSRSAEELSREEILEGLAPIQGNKYEVTLLGGEPTLREDLPEIIREISSRGFSIKLISNGLRMEDPSYVKMLKEAGLRWVILQFDGFSDEIYEKLRGQKLLEKKKRIIENLSRENIHICLAIMLVAGVNDHQIDDMIRFGVGHDHIHHLAFLPASSIGRDQLDLVMDHLSPEDVMRRIEKQSGARILEKDFINTMKLMSRIHKVTGHIDFRQRVCFFPLPVIGNGADYLPAVRMFQPTYLLRHPTALRKMVFLLRHFFNIDRVDLPPEITFVTIEKLYNVSNIDLSDAKQCNTLYLTRKGFIPSCMYNSIYRKTCI